MKNGASKKIVGHLFKVMVNVNQLRQSYLCLCEIDANHMIDRQILTIHYRAYNANKLSPLQVEQVLSIGEC